MKLKNMSNEELNEKIQILLQIIIDDLKNLKEPNGAGWRKPSDLEYLGISNEDLAKLSKLGILERNPLDEIRIRYKDNKIRERLPSFDIQFQQIDYFIENREMLEQDFERIRRAEGIIQKNISTWQSNEEFISNAVAIGIWRMLKASDMPAVVDDILSVGFSPKDWGIISFCSAPYLSLELVKKVGKIKKLEDAFNYMKKLEFISEIPDLDKLNAGNISKVKKILKWQEICETLSDSDIKFIGLSWFVIFILEKKDVLPFYINFSTKVVNLIKSCIENIMKTKYSNLVDSLINSLNVLEEQYNIQWASNIIFLPEVL
jgi:hypothetical protein